MAQLKKVKTGLTKRDLKKFRDLLLSRRAEILGDVESLNVDSSSTEISALPLHMADAGTDNYDREFNLGLLESEKKIVREIDEALQRMSDGYYGVCLETAQPIERPRLEIKPEAKYCIEVVRERERRGRF